MSAETSRGGARPCRLGGPGDMTLHGRALLPCTPVRGNFPEQADADGRRRRGLPLMLLPTGYRTTLVDLPSSIYDNFRRLRSSASLLHDQMLRDQLAASGDGIGGAAGRPLMVDARPSSRSGHLFGSDAAGRTSLDANTLATQQDGGGGGGNDATGGRGSTVNTWSRSSVQEARKAAAERSRLAALERSRLKRERELEELRKRREAPCDICRSVTEPFGGEEEFLAMMRAGRVSAVVERSLSQLPEHDCEFRRRVSQLSSDRLKSGSQGGADGTAGDDVTTGNNDDDDVFTRGDGGRGGGAGGAGGGGGVDGWDDASLGGRRTGASTVTAAGKDAALQARLALQQQQGVNGSGSGNKDRTSRSSMQLKTRRSLLNGLQTSHSAAAAGNDDDDDLVSWESFDEDGHPVRRHITRRELRERMLRGRRGRGGRGDGRDGSDGEDGDGRRKGDGLDENGSSDDALVSSALASTPAGQVPGLPDPHDRRSTTTSRPRLGASVATSRQRSSVLDGNHPRSLRGRADGLDSRYVYPALTDDRTEYRSSETRLGAMPESCYLSQPISAGRFELPIGYDKLEELSVTEYLTQCCRLSADQSAIYRLVYEHRANRLTSKLHSNELRLALRDIIPVDVTPDDVTRLCAMCGGLQPDKEGMGCELFIGIASLAARLLQHWATAEDTSSSSTVDRLPALTSRSSSKKTLLESTDLSALDRKLGGIDVNADIRQLLAAI